MLEALKCKRLAGGIEEVDNSGVEVEKTGQDGKRKMVVGGGRRDTAGYVDVHTVQQLRGHSHFPYYLRTKRIFFINPHRRNLTLRENKGRFVSGLGG